MERYDHLNRELAKQQTIPIPIWRPKFYTCDQPTNRIEPPRAPGGQNDAEGEKELQEQEEEEEEEENEEVQEEALAKSFNHDEKKSPFIFWRLLHNLFQNSYISSG